MENERRHGVLADKRSKVIAGVALSAVLVVVGDTGVQSHESYAYAPLPTDDFKTVEIENGKKEDLNVINRDNSPGERVIVVFPSPSESPSSIPSPSFAPSSTPELTPKPSQTEKPKSSLQVSSPGVFNFDPNVSWYGPNFYGHRTACGQTLTKTIMGVANKTLPCGTLVDFKYKGADGVTREAIVPVIDRGPYVAGRQWDLTGGLAVYLHHTFTGPIYYKIVK